MKHLKLNTFKSLYKDLKTGVPPLDFLLLGFLVWIEEAYIDYKTEKAVTEAVETYIEEHVEEEPHWTETAIIKEEWEDKTVPLPTLSISHPFIGKDESPQ